VREALIHGKSQIREVWVAEGKKPVRTREILQIAKQRNIPVLVKDNTALTRILPGISHQGIAALVEEFTYVKLDQLATIHPQKQGLLVALDHITDEGNLGAIIRTAVFFGTHGLIIPKDRSAGVSAKVLKRSSGAHVHLPIARVVNMGRALDLLKKRGFWIIGASGESQSAIYKFDWNRDVVLVLGNEQRGLSRSVRKQCHQVVSIPVSGHAESLNVAVAGGVILAEIVRQRNWLTTP
jgi:23S rRNA (guanosine2251-2'-O)-methyltransferase